MTRSVALVVAVLGAYGLRAEGQQSPRPPASPPVDARPTFRGGVELVQLDVSVLDERRRPITGLTAADFTVTENGKSRPIASFAAVELPGPSAAPAAWTREVAPDVVSNAPVDGGRLVVILLDRTVSVGQPTITARSIARAAIEELGPNDQAAVMFTGFGTPQNFTSDRARLLAAIERADSSTEPSPDAAEGVAATAIAAAGLQPGQCYCGICVPETIAHVAESVRHIPRRKSLLFIGSSVTFQSPAIDCAFRLRDATNRMMQALDRANVTIHSFDPGGLENATSFGRASSPMTGGAAFARAPQQIVAQQSGQNSLHVLPDRTGGRVVVNTNAPQVAVRAVMDESRAYYLLAFESDEQQRDKSREIRVRTSRRGARVYTQRRYQPQMPGSVDARGSEVTRSLAGATTTANPIRDLPLAVSLVPLAAPGETAAEVLVVVGVAYPLSSRGGAASLTGLPATAAGGGEDVREELTLLATAYDRFARPRGVDERVFTFARPALASGTAPFDAFARLPLRPGSYEVRIAAATSQGTTSGSVFSYVDVPNFRSLPLSVSGLMLSDPTSAAAAADVVADRLPITPTARRSFAPTDRIEAFARVYQGGNHAVADVEVHLRMTTAAGLVVLDRTLTIEAARFAPSRSADLRSELPFALLPSGEHLLSLDLQQGSHRVSRQMRFAIAGPR